jgi:hypothetical protein
VRVQPLSDGRVATAHGSPMTDDELRRRAQAWAERTAIAQGLAVKIDNPLILKAVADILWPEGKNRPRT